MNPGTASRTAATRTQAPRTSAAALLLASATVAALLTGCGIGNFTDKTATPITLGGGIKANGQVMGGQQPVAGVSLQLYAVANTYGGAATPLFTANSVFTTSAGNFTFPSYTCPSGNPNVFLVGTGGTPIGGSANANLSLMAGLGACSTSANAFINMNELTTVATVWALSGFMTGPSNIGAPASNLTGLNNAFAAINKVVNVPTGVASGPALPIGATLPILEINALGDILQNCVNSAGGSASDTTDGLTNGTPCGKLFYNAPNSTGTAPTDVITAALNIAQHPGVNTAHLNALQASSPAFSPSLSVNAPPTDWTIAINYTAGGFSTPQSVATDASGNVWITNKAANTVTILSNTGAPVSGTSGYPLSTLTAPYGIAIDASGNGWVTGSTSNSIAKVTPTGTVTPYSGNGLNAPKGIAIDGSANIWVADSGSTSVSAFTSTGAVLTGSPFSGGGVSAPTAIAISPR